MKKLGVIFLLFLSIFSLSFSRSRVKLAEEIPWELGYTYNKYGEKEKIKGAVYGQWARLEEIYVDRNGITISIVGQAYMISSLHSEIVKVSFLFDSKKEIIIDDFEETKTEGLIGKAVLIKNSNEKYKQIINCIKQSNKMSILLEDEKGGSALFSNINNKGSNSVLTKLENSF